MQVVRAYEDKETDGTVVARRSRELKIPFSFGMLSFNLARGIRRTLMAWHIRRSLPRGADSLDSR